MTVQVTILGCGTSTGVPVLGCDCDVCKSADPRNQRWRSSILVKTSENIPIVIDTGPEFRLQLLRAGVSQLQYVLYTHLHADHCHGFDDLRGLFFNNRQPITCHLDPEYVGELKHRFHYAFEDTGYLGGKPDIQLVPLPQNAGTFSIAGQDVDTVQLPHGNVYTNAFRFGEFAYATDFKEFTQDAMERWRGKIHTMVASGLRWRDHKTHSTIGETLAIFKALGVKRGIVTHMNHEIEYIRDSKLMPDGVELAYDGLTIESP